MSDLPADKRILPTPEERRAGLAWEERMDYFKALVSAGFSKENAEWLVFRELEGKSGPERDKHD